MSSTSSFVTNISTEEKSHAADPDLLSPRSPISPRGAAGDETAGEWKAPRRHSHSSVRFYPGLDIPEDENQASSLLTVKDGRSAPPETQQSQIEVLEDQIRALEARLTQNGCLQAHDSTEDGDGTERSGMNTEPQWLTWHEYQKPIKRASSILEVLTERPHTRRKLSEASMMFERPIPNPLKNIKRIRIRSHHIVNILQTITEHAFEDVSCLTIHRPFKILLHHQKELEAYLSDLEHAYSSMTPSGDDNQCEGPARFVGSQSAPDNSQTIQHPTNDLDTRSVEVVAHEPLPTSERRERFASFEEEEPASLPRHKHHNIDGTAMKETAGSMGDELGDEDFGESLPQKEAISHLSALVTFMKQDMGPIFERHRLLRSSKAVTVTFEELWHLFMPGDLVVGDDEQNPRLYRVSIIPPSGNFSKMQPVKEVRVQSDGQVPQVESTQREALIQCFNIDVFCFDWDGESYGPVESRVKIIAFEGEKRITDLSFYPLRFRQDAATYKSQMVERGARFIRLCTEWTAHRDYNGLSMGEPQEHIDSQVLVDGNLAYRMHPERAPKFGLRSWMESHGRLVREACDIPGCNACSDSFKNRLMFDDHRIDRRRTFDFVRVNRPLLRIVSDSEEMTEDLIVLLPNTVYGFVLRTRRWHLLNIANIRPIQRHTEGFDALILPDGVARLVEGLVQTHDPQETSEISSSKDQPEHQVDLVRGKGKGRIILLHGAPGVGKTSTAECVAEYTQRPLFPITCGDIGETAKEVETNLEQNFSLAHRWGCVLLLDEADVFLQARDKEDMRRNSVVSVFLRVLEYYSGILILTTNKVGHFDEAFKSRIHVSLYYPPLSKKSSLQVWKMNLARLITNRSHNLTIDRDAIEDYAKQHYRNLRNSNRATWNGRQIKNAFQTAVALAEFDAKSKHSEGKQAVLTREHFEVVAKASEGFDDYLSRIHGTDADRARRGGERDDDEIPISGGGRRSSSALFPLVSPRKTGKKYADSSDSSSSEDEDEKLKKRRKKEKKAKRRAEEEAKLKAKEGDGDDSSSSE